MPALSGDAIRAEPRGQRSPCLSQKLTARQLRVDGPKLVFLFVFFEALDATTGARAGRCTSGCASLAVLSRGMAKLSEDDLSNARADSGL